jgi:hypothetical protein
MIPRSFVVLAWMATSLCAAPPLTLIQDVLYKADGTQFNGSLTISWTSFQAIDHTAIMQQQKTVVVVNGNLLVPLVPTTTATPAAYYTVVYNSDGRVQFTETWTVPSSITPLRVRDVRIASFNAATGAGIVGADSATIPENSVIGLLSDLGARPLRGPGYAAGRVAWSNASGALETVTGTPTDCVHVDGSSGPCGGAQPGFVDSEAPAGLVDGSNAAFTLAGAPNPSTSLALYRNGVLQKAGLDFTLSSLNISFLAGAAPQPGDTVAANYRLGGVPSAGSQMYPSPQILCSGLGGGTNSSTLSSIGNCVIPAGFLAAGDRVEVRFDFDHQGTAGAFTVAVQWGGTTVLSRNGSASDVQLAGRADAALTVAGAQLNHQSWGTLLTLAAGVGSSTFDYTAGVTVNFQGMTALTGETVTLRNFTVTRYP